MKVPSLKMKRLSNNVMSLQGLEMNHRPKKIKDFQDEFMGKYEEFSLSWREAIKREKRF